MAAMLKKLTTLLCKNITVPKSKEVKAGSYMAESSKEFYAMPMMILVIQPLKTKKFCAELIVYSFFDAGIA
jgi:hypothetical protein